jgi:hypothetical protein
MYYTENTLYLLWEGDKRFSPLPTVSTFTRSRSPSPPSSLSRSPSPEPIRPIAYINRKPRQYISYDSLEILYDFEEPLKNWREVSEEYITKSLNISHSIPYKILNVFITKENSKIVFKVLSYQLQLDTITLQIVNKMKLSIPILHISIIDKYVADPNTANIRVNCSLSHIPIFSLMGRDKFSFTVTLNELEETTKKCFDAFRNLCRSDTVLTELFEKSIVQYFDSSREHCGVIIREFLDSQK